MRMAACGAMVSVIQIAAADPTVVPCVGSGPLIVEVTMGGKPLRFMFDTALPGDGRIDEEVAKELGLASAGVLATDEDGGGIPLVRGEKFGFGGQTFETVTFWSVPLGAMKQPAEQRIDGAIGWQLLKGRVYTVDLANRRIVIDDEPLKDAGAPGVAALIAEEHSPSIPISLGGVETRATLNSGNMMGLVVPNAMQSKLTLTKEPWVSGKIGNGQSIRRGRLKTPMSVGGLATPMTGVEFLDVWETPNMGFMAMEPYAFTFDLVNQRVRIAEPAGKPRPARYGVAFDAEQSPARIVRIFDLSVADKAGLREGDAIKSINGVEVKTQQEILTAMRAPKVTMVVERDGQPVTIEMSRE
ncbi:MAG: aspartyl protease family protein [Phycisphaeraceae bacterium]|nr:aspartyl protease family protein [Phycisphaeraceae bacterium]